MDRFLNILILLATISQISTENEVVSSTSTQIPPELQQPLYKTPEQPPIPYIPHQTYPYYDGYRGYEGYYEKSLAKHPIYLEQPSGYMSSVIPATQSALQFILKALAKFGLFLIGGAALLLVGGIFTTALCYLTPICVISFSGFSGLDKESVRSLMTPDKISAAAAMVQDAIGKYQRLQRAVGSP
ncbi:uncharacterized protein [Leptinotarsa decemlineata]|uniref:uncharacterized protein n=1 Tax=Leptinotarsa decemlineata TaxID=7539 RepID=UPI000C253A9C|nr:uncharacterized protein LOC111512139 [Leptinotarsa decemlineata]